jgi:chitodextrinase
MTRNPRWLAILLALFVVTDLPLRAQSSLVRGREADGERLGRAATSLRMSVDDIRRLAQRDADLHVSRAGRLVYACRRSPAKVVGTNNSAFVGTPIYPLDQTFKLHSRPGAARVLYLDFTGHTIIGTAWNEDFERETIVIPAFSIDADGTKFSAAEQTVIQQVWRRVAEDFAPFDVDVTTEEPDLDAILRTGPADEAYGVRAVIGGNAEDLSPELAGMGILGIAQLGAFGIPTDTPALNFSRAHGSDWAMLADTVSHEVGHTLDLLHHGSARDGEYYRGHGNWAPIMGSGPSSSVSQWSRGDYTGATNPTQDDLAVIALRIPPAPIDHPPTLEDAEAIDRGDIAAGTILNAADTAWYRIEAGGGLLTLNGIVSALGPNLKLGLSLRDADGNLLAQSSTTTASMSATLSHTLTTAGTYYAVVDGIGYRTVNTGFTDYASLGRFQLTGNWAINQPPIASTAGSTPLLGAAPLTVAFRGSNSFDFDGTIVAYAWDFGNGATSTLANPSHTYATPGTYRASLTVTDSVGATHTTEVPVTATAKPIANRPLRVLSMAPSWVSVSRTTGVAQCVVRVVDSGGRPMPGVTVTVSVQGLDTAALTVTSDRQGNAVFRSAALPVGARGPVTFTVREVILEGYTYLPALNRLGSATLRR